MLAQHQLRMAFLHIKNVEANYLLQQGLLAEHEELSARLLTTRNLETYVLYVLSLRENA